MEEKGVKQAVLEFSNGGFGRFVTTWVLGIWYPATGFVGKAMN